jgi:hypothetical protein
MQSKSLFYVLLNMKTRPIIYPAYVDSMGKMTNEKRTVFRP